MTQFVDAYLPASVVGFPCTRGPRFNTSITQVSGGDEGNNQNWTHPLRRFILPEAAARGAFATILALEKHWLAVGIGPHRSFPFRDPLDFASVDLVVPNEPTDAWQNGPGVLARISATDQALGTGDGVTRTFQLSKTYTIGGQSYARPIGLPIVADLLIADNGATTSAYAVTRPGGVVTFTSAPTDGHALTWGGLFDVPVRYDADDGFDAVVRSWHAAGFAQLNLDEVRLC